MMKSKKIINSAAGLAAIIVGILALNVISSKLNLRVDVTQDDIFTLSEGTENILKKLNRDIQAKFYFSRSSKELPVIIKTYATRVEEVLAEYASLSDGKMTIEIFDPKPDTDEEEWARKYGLKGAKLPSGNDIFFGVVFIAGDREIAIPYFDPRREEFLEYDLSEALVRLQDEQKAKIGLLSWLPLMGSGMPQQFGGGEQGEWTIVQQLKRIYDVVELDKDSVEIDPEIKTLMIVHPKDISERLSYALDQFVLRGGHALVFVDPFSRTDLASAPSMGMQQRMNQSASSDLPVLFKNWGVEYKADEIVGDLKHTVQINAGGQIIPYPFFMGLTADSVSKESVVTSQLSNLLFAEPGAFALKEGAELKLEPLVFTDEQSGTAGAMMVKFMGPAEFAKQIKVEDKVRNIAAVLTGKFKTAFAEGAPKSDDKEASKPTQPHLKESSGKGLVMLVGDVDFMADQNSVDQFRLGPQIIVRPKNDNLSFVINAVDYLGGDEDLISIRSRGKISRPFTKVQQLQAVAQKKWKDQEEKLSSELSELQSKLNELQSGRTQGNRLILSEEQQDTIEEFQDRVSEVRKKRREVRKNLREDIERLGKQLVAGNMIFVPLLVGILGLVVFVRRNNNRRRS